MFVAEQVAGFTPVTIYDVAREAGVSISTVSNALNRPARVSESTRLKVLDTAHELGYIPKPQAASLARKSARRIGVFAPFTSYDSFLRRLSGILGEAAGSGIEVAVFDHGSAASLSTPVLEAIPLQARFDGVIVMGIGIDKSVEMRLMSRGIPAVVIDAPSNSFPSLIVDDFDGGVLAARHLLDLGHRRFGYIAERQATAYESQSTQRLRGFQAEIGKTPGTHLAVHEAAPTVDGATDEAHALLEVSSRPTAIVAHFDRMGVGVLRAAAARGLSVPGDLSVMAFDDGPAAEAANLTTVRQPFEESGVLAFRLLVAEGSNLGMTTRTHLQLALVPRASTGPARS